MLKMISYALPIQMEETELWENERHENVRGVGDNKAVVCTIMMRSIWNGDMWSGAHQAPYVYVLHNSIDKFLSPRCRFVKN